MSATTLTLSGWTQPADALSEALPGAAIFDYSDYASPEAALDALGKRFADVPYIVGWSLGGQLALRAIATGVLTPRHLTLIATPWQFIGDDGMGEETFGLFRAGYRQEPLRSMDRFAGLIAKGDTAERSILRLFRHHADAGNPVRWLPWLDTLALRPLGDLAFDHLPPTLLIHGEQDAIVPVAQAGFLKKALPQVTVSYWTGTGHAPHLHDPERLRREIAEHRAAQKVAA